MNKYGLRIAVVLVLVSLIFFILYTFSDIGFENKNAPKTVELSVQEGESFSQIAKELENKGVVKSAIVLRLRAEEKGLDRKIAPGKYRFSTDMSYEEVLSVFEKGPLTEFIKVTIPEGYTVKQIAEKLSQLPGFDRDSFLEISLKQKSTFEDDYDFLKQNPTQSLEGYLFPDTYFFTGKESEEQIIRTMLDNFQKKLNEIEIEKSTAGNELTLHEIITIASIIEKEARLPEERKLVASVIYNRLEKGMLLQMCSTVQYLLEEPKENLTEEDLQIESPYNTYLHRGLPPGPICNPGKDSIEAALQPAETDYLYYVLVDDSGKHFFTSSYDEFLKAKQNRK